MLSPQGLGIGGHLTVDSTLQLVRKAKDGDRDAWSCLVQRYYDDWLRNFHNELGTTLRRKVGDTVDLVDSALADALRDVPTLRNEAVFFAWMTTIVRRKIGDWRRRVRHKEAKLGPDVESPPPAEEKMSVYVETLDAMISLFREFPEEMAVMVWKNLDGLSTVQIAKRLGVSENTARKRMTDGIALLEKRLSHA
jgi:RNA polymerase sigma factor (sigma-70 family)